MKPDQGWFFMWILVSYLGFAQNREESHAVCKRMQAAQWNWKTHSSISSPQHRHRMRQYDVTFYWLDLHIERTSTYVEGNVLIKAKSLVSQLDTFAFELDQAMQVDSIFVDGQLVPLTRLSLANRNERNLLLPNPISQGHYFTVKIFYHGTPPVGGSAIGSGMNNGTSPTWGNRVTWSLTQPYTANHWFPCKQELEDKADSVYFYITTSVENKAGSNGILVGIDTLNGGTQVRYRWITRYPIAYYLIAVAVARYVDYSFTTNINGKNVLVQNYVYDNPGTLVYYKSQIDTTGPLLQYFSALFGEYPFSDEKYGHCMAPFSGGMEHQTMTFQGFFFFTLTAHELLHQWFGDYVTCGTWRDIWLNEGFASYGEYLVLNHFDSYSAAQQWMGDAHSNVMSQPGGSVYVDDTTNVNRIFSGRLTYDKGAAVIHTLRHIIQNDSLFFAGLRTYLQTYAFDVATTPQFQQVMEQVTGMNLQSFFDEWIYGEGYPTYSVRWNQIGSDLILEITQTTSMPSVTPLFTTPMEYKILRTQGDTIVRLTQTQNTQTFVIPISGTVTGIVVDPDNDVINRIGSVIKDTTLTSVIPSTVAAPVNWQIYPNPFSHTLCLYADQPGRLMLYTLHGKEIASFTFEKGYNFFPLSDLASATYLVHVTFVNGSSGWSYLVKR
jgi:aminopeptidase N